MFDFGKIADQIGEKIKPALQATKEQAELNMLVQAAAQLMAAETMRGSTRTAKQVLLSAKELIEEAKK